MNHTRKDDDSLDDDLHGFVQFVQKSFIPVFAKTVFHADESDGKDFQFHGFAPVVKEANIFVSVENRSVKSHELDGGEELEIFVNGNEGFRVERSVKNPYLKVSDENEQLDLDQVNEIMQDDEKGLDPSDVPFDPVAALNDSSKLPDQLAFVMSKDNEKVFKVPNPPKRTRSPRQIRKKRGKATSPPPDERPFRPYDHRARRKKA